MAAQQSVSAGTKPLDVARSISPRLADDAIVAKVDGQFWDLTRPLEYDARLEILTYRKTPKPFKFTGTRQRICWLQRCSSCFRNKARYRTAHRRRILLRLPARSEVHSRRPQRIEQKCSNCRKRNLPFERKLTSKDEGLRKYADDWMKRELISEKADATFSEYTLGPDFIDFCRGPHVPSTAS